MTSKKHAVEDLFSDSGPFDEAEVVKTIQPFITIQKSTNEIFFKNTSCPAEIRVLIYGLAKKLLKTKGFIESDMITALEVHKKTGIKKGTIDPAFKKLKEGSYLVGKGQSEIPTSKISEILALINRKREA